MGVHLQKKKKKGNKKKSKNVEEEEKSTFFGSQEVQLDQLKFLSVSSSFFDFSCRSNSIPSFNQKRTSESISLSLSGSP